MQFSHSRGRPFVVSTHSLPFFICAIFAVSGIGFSLSGSDQCVRSQKWLLSFSVLWVWFRMGKMRRPLQYVIEKQIRCRFCSSLRCLHFSAWVRRLVANFAGRMIDHRLDADCRLCSTTSPSSPYYVRCVCLCVRVWCDPTLLCSWTWSHSLIRWTATQKRTINGRQRQAGHRLEANEMKYKIQTNNTGPRAPCMCVLHAPYPSSSSLLVQRTLTRRAVHTSTSSLTSKEQKKKKKLCWKLNPTTTL